MSVTGRRTRTTIYATGMNTERENPGATLDISEMYNPVQRGLPEGRDQAYRDLGVLPPLLSKYRVRARFRFYPKSLDEPITVIFSNDRRKKKKKSKKLEFSCVP